MLIDLNVIRGLAKIASKDEHRPNLCGVLIERRGRELFYVATNGHVLCAFRRTLDEDAPDGPDVELIVPLDVATRCRPAHSGPMAELTIGEEYRIEPTKTGPLVFKSGDGRFPAWRRIVPTTIPANGEQANFEYTYLAAIKACIAEATGRKLVVPSLYANGNSAALIVDGPDFVGVIMPVRGREPLAVPEWVTGKVEPLKAAA